MIVILSEAKDLVGGNRGETEAKQQIDSFLLQILRCAQDDKV